MNQVILIKNRAEISIKSQANKTFQWKFICQNLKNKAKSVQFPNKVRKLLQKDNKLDKTVLKLSL